MPYRFVLLLALLVSGFWLSCSRAAHLCRSSMVCPDLDNANDTFESIRSNHNQLTTFLTNFPKGGNLHHHLMGAMEAGRIIRRAIEKGLCYDETIGIVECNGSLPSVKNYTESYSSGYTKLEQKLMSPNEGQSLMNNHVLFFEYFPFVSSLFFDIDADFVSEVRRKAAFEQLFYIESTIYWNELSGPDQLFGLLQNMPSLEPLDNETMAAFRGALVSQPQFKKQVDQAQTVIASSLVESDKQLGCSSAAPPSACSVLVRFLHEIHRTNTLPEVFAQIIFAFELAQKSITQGGSEVLGINIVGPEDHPVALRDYDSHLAMLAYMKNLKLDGHQVYDQVAHHLSLHAGELNNEFADTMKLATTLGDTIQIVKPARIGHGLSIMKQVCAEGSEIVGCADALMKEMAISGMAVEVPFTSNRVLSGFTPATHPFPNYVANQVPVVIASDDPGVLRVNLTSQFVEAVYGYNSFEQQRKPLITLDKLIEFTRNGLEYSFLPGKSLWKDSSWKDKSYSQYVSECISPSSTVCKLFLQQNLKARKQMEHEENLSHFLKSSREEKRL